MSKEAIKTAIPESPSAFLALGLLASGGSGFWNSVLTYLTKVQEIKKADAEEKKAQLAAIRRN